ncbi:Ferredoxin [Anaerovibrio sp. JC8]|uniref:DUF362 domain-containing protein n=1 Tax=Anaerovibrio sp. JC8 TaxID=1240085 RepID=UPI000A0C7009|nr:DUF362 domain-containing protein [Anaerovibrio sp. JC8]ORU00103.1 Ferredoxin [Anaerovibrio sp. JC8]
MKKVSRRSFVKIAGMATAALSVSGLLGITTGCAKESGSSSASKPSSPDIKAATGGKSKVYFSKNIDSEHLIKLYEKVNGEITGKTAIKLHTGEPHGPNILPRDMVKAFQGQVPNSTIVEANVAYGGPRSSTSGHLDTLKVNGWNFCPVDIIDADGDVPFPVNGGLHLKEVAVGSHLADYDSMVVLTHFKGHAMGGFGGSLKNIAIGCASGNKGKKQVHGVADYGKWVTGGLFMELMADSGKAICDHFGKHITFLNVMRRMSVDCDCAGTSAAEPVIPDIGILASTDILAIDQASIDLVYNFGDDRKKDLIERIESREGLRQLTAMQELGMGNRDYELISVD